MAVEVDEHVHVVCRFRPLAEREILADSSATAADVVCFAENGNEVSVAAEADGERRVFSFDRALPPTTSQASMFDQSCAPLINGLLEGTNATILAYGPKSAGKTHTIQGTDGESEGVLPRAMDSLFAALDGSAARVEATVRVSMVELRAEVLFDLQRAWNDERQVVRVRQQPDRTVELVGAHAETVSSAADVRQFVASCNVNCLVRRTAMGETRSRSHIIFMLELEQRDKETQKTVVSKLAIVDLAGSERMEKGPSPGEARAINVSLISLANCIRARVERKAHVPYRDSKLTFILQDSLAGHARVLLVGHCSPARANVSETLFTLAFCEYARRMKTSAKPNTPIEKRETNVEPR